jgi:hypothetical protein
LQVVLIWSLKVMMHWLQQQGQQQGLGYAMALAAAAGEFTCMWQTWGHHTNAFVELNVGRLEHVE